MKAIVVGYDETEPAMRALERAAEQAAAFGAKVIVTSVAHAVHGKGIGPDDLADPPELHREELTRAAAFLAERGVEGEYDLVLGEPASKIVELAEQRDADLIVVDIRVGDVMSDDPLLAAPEDTLGEVAERMRERDTGSVLVAEYGRLIGILTSRDMLRALAGRVHASEARVRQWMTTDPIAVGTTTTLDAAMILMTEHAIHHLPVVDAMRPVGMVGMRDIVRAPAKLGAGVGLGF